MSGFTIYTIIVVCSGLSFIAGLYTGRHIWRRPFP
jgi:hypothetical protein